MAPEYVIQGILTDKADVYSFGVLVLEIVCGRQNNIYAHGSGSVLQTVSLVLHLRTDLLYVLTFQVPQICAS